MDDHTDPTLQPSFYEIERQAQHERSIVINALMQATARGFATWLRVIGRVGGRVLRRLVADGVWRSRIRALQRLDDRVLADIGVPRGEIEFAVRGGRPLRAIRKMQRRHAGRRRVIAHSPAAA